MKTTLTAIALAAALAQPADAVTFPSLSTIYVGAGAYDDGGADNLGTATAITCANVSGLNADVRVLILGTAGNVEGQVTFNSVLHGASLIVTTHLVAPLFQLDLATGAFVGGIINIESTQSGVFCQAVIMAAAGPLEASVPLRLVRVNPHPGTVE